MKRAQLATAHGVSNSGGAVGALGLPHDPRCPISQDVVLRKYVEAHPQLDALAKSLAAKVLRG